MWCLVALTGNENSHGCIGLRNTIINIRFRSATYEVLDSSVEDAARSETTKNPQANFLARRSIGRCTNGPISYEIGSIGSKYAQIRPPNGHLIRYTSTKIMPRNRAKPEFTKNTTNV